MKETGSCKLYSSVPASETCFYCSVAPGYQLGHLQFLFHLILKGNVFYMAQKVQKASSGKNVHFTKSMPKVINVIRFLIHPEYVLFICKE